MARDRADEAAAAIQGGNPASVHAAAAAAAVSLAAAEAGHGRQWVSVQGGTRAATAVYRAAAATTPQGATPCVNVVPYSPGFVTTFLSACIVTEMPASWGLRQLHLLGL